MKKKNEIEQELDRKEFENEVGRDLASQYQKIEVEEKLTQGKNKYVIGAMNFFSTFVFFEVFYWCVSTIVNYVTFGLTTGFFMQLSIFVHTAILVLAIYSLITHKSPIVYILKMTPNGWF
jgi:acetylglutamate synthase